MEGNVLPKNTEKCSRTSPLVLSGSVACVARLVKLTCVVILLSACRSGRPPLPAIGFTRIPPSTHGGSERLDTIAGKVSGASPQDQVVVYARSGPWWVQPQSERPLIPVQRDLSWQTETHLGYEYAALLVRNGYAPAATLDALPEPGGSVLALTTAKGVGSLPPPPTVPIRFAGYGWNVDTTSGVRGGVNHLFAPSNVWVDQQGALHLKIEKAENGWLCAHLVIAQSLGYGTYSFRVREATHLDPESILSFDTFDEWAADQHYREMDIELGRWDDPGNKANSQVGLQPFYVPGNIVQFHDPPGRLIHVLHWRPGEAAFETFREQGRGPKQSLVYKQVFRTGVPSPGRELAEFMFYLVGSDSHLTEDKSEIVIERFDFTP